MKETPLDFDFLILNRIPTLYSAQRFQSEIDRLKLRGLLISPEDLNRFMSQIKTNDQGIIESDLRSFPKILYRQGDYNFWPTHELLANIQWKVINHPEAFMKARDKWVTHQVWEQNKIPAPKTILASMLTPNFLDQENEKFKLNTDEILNHLSAFLFKTMSATMGCPFILKKRISSQGRGVFLIQQKETLDDIFEADARLFKSAPDLETQYFLADSALSPDMRFGSELLFLTRWMFQECVHESLGRDIRIFSINENSFAIERRNKNTFRSNLHQGGIPSLAKLSTTEIEWFEKVQTLCELQYSGVDFLRTASGPLFIEVNPSPGFEGIESIYKKNIAIDLLKLLQPTT